MPALSTALRVPLLLALALVPLPVLGASGSLTPSPWKIIYQQGEHAVSQRTLPNGDTEYAFAELPPGAAKDTGDVVVESDGHPRGAAAPGTQAVALSEPVDCSIQGAYALYHLCGINRLHWSGTHPAVYFIDFTGSNWPVYEAVVQWNYSTALDSGYVPRSIGGCNHTHCVWVYSSSYTDSCGDTTNWVGCTTVRVVSGTTLISNDTFIRLNDRFSSTYDQNQIATCHELGHALGLDHNLYTNSCMYYQRTSGGSKYPATGDYLMLEDIY